MLHIIINHFYRLSAQRVDEVRVDAEARVDEVEKERYIFDI